MDALAAAHRAGAKTDDDSGNTDVYVSDVYIKGGNNDEPVPGLPVC